MSEQLKLAKELYNDPRMMLTPLDLVSTPLDLAPTPLRCSSYKHPWTPPHPTPNCVFGNLLDVPIHWAFPVTVRSQGLAAAALGYGQVVLGAKKVALSPAPRSGSGPRPGPHHILRPKRNGLAPPPLPGHGNAQKLGTPSNWNAIPLHGNAR